MGEKVKGMGPLTRGPAKLATKAALRGSSQQIEEFESRECILRRDPLGQAVMSSPKAVFNGRRHYSPRGGQPTSLNSGNMLAQEAMTPQHEENVRYIYDAWMRIQHEMQYSHRQGREALGPVYYQEKDPVTNNDFEPVDLDQWLADRMYEKIKQKS